MKNCILLFLTLLSVAPAWAQPELKPIAREVASRQRGKAVFTAANDLFTLNTKTKDTQMRAISEAVSEASILELQPASQEQLLAQRPTNLSLRLPTEQGALDLQLYQVNPFAEGFSVSTSSGKTSIKTPGIHYRGIIKGDDQSIVAISVYDNDVMGLVADARGNRVLGRIGEAGNQYVLYNDKNLKQKFDFECKSDGLKQLRQEPDPFNSPNAARTTASKCVRLYWEAAYELYTNKGSNTANVVNYLSGLFNQSKLIYDNDGIGVTLSEIFVWDTQDPYGRSLDNFGRARTSFNGDVAHLISLGSSGVAWVNGVCQTPYRYAYSGIYANYSNLPTYSWSVNVITHEQGHVFGSTHTHSCAWNGNNTAIDSCVPTGGCASAEGSRPAAGGTVMSYCHQTSVGVNFANGFGPQPRQRIINALNATTCLAASCPGTGPVTPPPPATGYCTSNGTSVSQEWLALVQLGSINRSSGADGGYYDGTATSTNIAAGSSQTINFAAGFSGTVRDEYVKVYADWNQNNVFTDANEAIVSAPASSSNATRSANFTVPTNAKLGKTRLRVVLSAASATASCGAYAAGETEDYSVNVTAATPPPPVVTCPSQGTSQANEHIDYVSIGAITRSSGADGGYYDGTASTSSATAGSTQTITLSAGLPTGARTEYWSIYADWDQNGTLDASELVNSSTSTTDANFTATFTVPATAKLGKARLRVIMSSVNTTTGCGTYAAGETEDYSLNVTAATPPPPPGGPAAGCVSQGTSQSSEYLAYVRVATPNGSFSR
uniref:GEVED domain-containing protein n=1 Tax=Hymenobacter terrenus TaxID=1629124 RepID=UPI000698EF43